MVYCGKPSRGCQMCRTRRIKCDETKPKCNQCAKSRRECPGYKDEFDLVFRNETQATERRARKANKKAIAKLNKDAGGDVSPNQPALPFKPYNSQVAIKTPRIPLDQQAECHFVSNWVLIPRLGGTRGFMEHLVPLLRTESHCYHFRTAFDACALASLNNRVGSGSEFEKESLGLYTKALSSTFGALKDPAMATKDTTLAAILLLGLYENISARQMGMLAWGSHIEGAIQLVKARGRSILNTQTGRLLFIAVRTQMIIHTLSTGTPPAMGVEWWIEDAVHDTHGAYCQKLNIKVGELRAEVNRLMSTVSRSHEDIELMLEMIRKCQIVNQELVSWAQGLPEIFKWQTVTWEDRVPDGDYSKAEAYPGRVDIYQDLWVVSVINMQRCARLILASLIVRCAAWACSPVDYRTTPEYATAARSCHEIITDIIASVPYQLGYFHKRKELHDRIAISGFACGDEDTIKGLPGYFLSWPLVCIYGQDYISDTQRAWVRGRLEFIGNHVGVRYAHILKQINVRVPSMLIRRDGLMANPYPTGHNFEKLLSARNAKPTPGYTMNPLQQREAMQSAHVEKQKAELLKKVVGTGKLDDWTAKTWLAFPTSEVTPSPH